jgi:hypothetical protein
MASGRRAFSQAITQPRPPSPELPPLRKNSSTLHSFAPATAGGADFHEAYRAPAVLPRVPRRTTAAAEARMNLRRHVKLSKRSAPFFIAREKQNHSPGQSRGDRPTGAKSVQPPHRSPIQAASSLPKLRPFRKKLIRTPRTASRGAQVKKHKTVKRRQFALILHRQKPPSDTICCASGAFRNGDRVSYPPDFSGRSPMRSCIF